MEWLDEQVRRNRMSRHCWGRYETHRVRVDAVLGAPQGAADHLCILGAGNCNDLDLRRLADRFRRICLVDLDAEALQYGLGVQQPGPASRAGPGPADARPVPFVLCGGVDVSGIAGRLRDWSPEAPPTDAQIDSCLQQAGEATLPVQIPPQDVVASVCLLSQMIEAVIVALGADHPRLLELIAVLRHRHLQLILDLLRSGGRGVVLIDFVSSDTCPSLATVADSQLGDLAMELLRNRNFFTGLNPWVLLHRVNESDLAGQVRHASLTPPWRWEFPARTYAVCALELVKA